MAEKVYHADQWYRKCEQDQWQTQNKIGRANNILTLFGVIVATVAAGGAWLAAYYAGWAYSESATQANAAMGQLDAMQQQERPWLRGTFSLVALSRDAGGVNFTIDPAIKNVGNYPALIVFVSERLVPGGNFFDELKEKKSACEDVRKAWPNIVKNPGNTVFPGGDNVLFPRTFGKLWQRDIDAWRQKIMLNWGPVNESSLSPERRAALRFIPLAFVGCITYGGTGQESVKQTGFILELSIGSSPLNVPYSGVFDLSAFGPYSLNGISLIQAAYGGDAN